MPNLITTWLNMASGKHRKEINARKHFVKSTLQKRFKEFLSLKNNIKSAISLLESDIIYTDNIKITLSDCLSPVMPYKNSIPKGYLKTLKDLKAKLKEQDENEQTSQTRKPLAANLIDLTDTQSLMPAPQSPIALHKVPLFENTELIDWPKDGRTNQLNRLVVAISRIIKQTNQLYDVTELFKQLDQIWSIARLPIPSTINLDSFLSFYRPLLQEAIEKFAKIEGISLMPFESAAKISAEQRNFKAFETFIRQQLTPSSSLAASAPPIKSSKKSPIPIQSHPSGDLERITDSFDMLCKAQQANRNKQGFTKKAIHTYVLRANHSSQISIPPIFVRRLFIGCGYAGMTLMSTDPSVPKLADTAFKQLEDYFKNPEKTQQLFLETLLISDKKTGYWTEAEHRAEQEHPLLEIAGNANASDFIPKSQSINRFKRTNTRHLFYSNTVNMALKSTPPPLFGARVQKLEARIKHLADWDTADSSYNFRVKVAIETETGIILTYIYAKTMDFALGMGVGQNTSFENALQYEKLRELSQHQGQQIESLALENQGKQLFARHSIYQPKKGYTPIIHGNEFDLSNRERQSIACVKTRRVVIIGGAGGAATAYRISLLGTDKSGYRLQNEKGEFLQNGPNISLNPNVKIFSRGIVSYRNLAKQATESFEYAKSKGTLYEGYLLIGIKVESDDIILRFHKRTGAKEIDKQTATEIKINEKHFKTEVVEDNNRYYLLNLHEERCDQLISGMGQDAS
ncbi:Uncharacterised protein [Legionella beliardensis]|uniref:Uncharacterized protein n=1 Tax=Legionella beliardensis TaxID=91822 RepID=A0A378I1W9_9GAMM|nr:hypothetical protein [Legionella beliardensis]STX29169.1 Uncharacterised protein [Legionella beliardensis]